MNERIKQLAEQAEIYAGELIDEGADYNQYPRYYTEKFAELIVAECCNVINAGKPAVNQVPAEVALDMTAKNVKAYFGVE